MAFSPDGRTLATSDNDGAVALWDVASQQPIGSPLPGLPDAWTTARFAPDGARLFAVSDTGRAIRWEVDPEAWLRAARAPSPAAASRLSSGRSSCRSRTTSQSAPRADVACFALS